MAIKRGEKQDPSIWPFDPHFSIITYSVRDTIREEEQINAMDSGR